MINSHVRIVMEERNLPSGRLGIVFKRLLRLGILAGVFALSATFVMYFALRGRTVEVPDVVGKTESDAEEVLDDFGLRMQIRTRVHSDKYPERSVTDQVPASGTAVKTGQLVRVTLSLGTGSSASRAAVQSQGSR